MGLEGSSGNVLRHRVVDVWSPGQVMIVLEAPRTLSAKAISKVSRENEITLPLCCVCGVATTSSSTGVVFGMEALLGEVGNAT